MHINAQDRVALFIDGANLYAAARALNFDIDYRRLMEMFRSRAKVVRALYYTALIESEEYSPIRPLVDWLDYNGYTLVTKPTKEFVDREGRRRIKGNMDIELAVDMMELSGAIDHAFLFSGDGDFRSLVEAVQRRGVRVSVVSSLRTVPPMVADELRRQADEFIDLTALMPDIERVHSGPRPPRRVAPGQAPAAPRPETGEEPYYDGEDEEDEGFADVGEAQVLPARQGNR